MMSSGNRSGVSGVSFVVVRVERSLGSVALRKMSGSRFVDGAEQPQHGDKTALLEDLIMGFPCKILSR
jgi:hypothetical protein